MRIMEIVRMHAMGMLEGYDKSVRGIPWEVGWTI